MPCKPTKVQASLQCHSNSAAVSWEGSSGAQSYLVVGVAEDGSHQVECNSTSTHCDLSHLQCGQKYNISVFGLDESCSSVESDKAYMRTGNVNKKQPRYDNKYCIHLEEYIPPPPPFSLSAPCAPQDVDVISQCPDGSVVVSWSQNQDAQHFQVIAVSDTGAGHHCNSSGTACTIENLPCGQNYSVSVVSVADGCESEPSAIVETSSGTHSPANFFSHATLNRAANWQRVPTVSFTCCCCCHSSVCAHKCQRPSGLRVQLCLGDLGRLRRSS